jgi:hypothetical protein
MAMPTMLKETRSHVYCTHLMRCSLCCRIREAGMGWQETVFEREPLYEEVWAEPVSTVAERYALSNVGLRKIRQKLGVPMPPLGYWARVEAGQTPRVTPLRSGHKGPTSHIRRVHVDEAAPERDRRTASLLAENQPSVWPTVVVPEALDDCHAVIRRTAKHLSSRSADPTKMLSASECDVFMVYVSQAQKERALRVLQGCMTALVNAGAVVIPGKPDGPAVHLQVVEQFVSMKIEELVDRSFREPRAKERAKQEKYSWQKPDLSVHTPNGKLKLTILSDNKYSYCFSVSDGVSRIENRLDDLVRRVWTKAAERNVRDQMREEEHQRWEQSWARHKALEEARQAELARLEKTEKTVQQWHRARLLREYADALGKNEQAGKTAERLAEVAWIRDAADWLDPLVAKVSPDVGDDD